jgi:HAD superfamily hydrolase (TIGR01484 family)
MRFLALATDYDGTLAHDGRVNAETLEALGRLKDSSRKLILVSGRQLPELKETFPEYKIFDLIVAENGALLYNPSTSMETLLVEPPSPRLAEELRNRGALPLAEGRAIVATWQPHESKVFEVIRDLGLEMQVIFNKGAVMILPSGVNKASGLQAALAQLGLSPHNVVAVGDAENDHALLKLCELGAAVGNALPSLKENADIVTQGDHGRGVIELINALLQDDLAALTEPLRIHELELGKREDGSPVRIPAYGKGLLIAGTSGGGKSTLASSFIERLLAEQYQYCIIDPEGDYAEMENAVVLGNAKRCPAVEEVMTALRNPGQNCVVNLIGIALADRPNYFERLFAALLEFRIHTGRPHWLILDEAHHIAPTSHEESISTLPEHIANMLFITLEPEHIARPFLRGVDLILAIGAEPRKTISTFSEAVGEAPPHLEDQPLERGQTMAWWRNPRGEPFIFRSTPPSLPRHRHIRKYAEGDLGVGAFIFRGPDSRFKLRAQNLLLFLQIGEGLDDLSWDYHLRRGDYENWFRWIVKDAELADFARGVAADMEQSPEQTRKAIRTRIEERYTAPK